MKVKAWILISGRSGKPTMTDGMIMADKSKKGAEFTSMYWAGSEVVPCTITYTLPKKGKSK